MANTWDPKTGSLRIKHLQHLIHHGHVTARQVLDGVLDRIDAYYDKAVFIHRPSKEQLYKRVEELEARWKSSPEAKHALPLFGIPYTVKDNLDVAGMPTTAACPEFAYTPTESATVVATLERLGAIMVGKTNLDQFAAGLVGTRSPYGVVHNSFNKEYISGGSSSGAGVSVSVGMCSFALGTDTAGSGRVPGCFNNVVGLKPSKGVLSAKGVVAAARMLDCVAIFALTCEDARLIFDYTASPDNDDRSREFYPNVQQLKRHRSVEKFTFAVPKKEQLKFFGNAEYERLYYEGLKRLESIGGVRTEFDYSVFTEAASMLYQGPPLAERLATLEDFFNKNPDAGLPLIKAIIEKGYKYSAVETYKSIWRLGAIRHEILASVFDHIDVLALPTTGTIYKIEEVLAQPMSLNTNLGYFTNFVNLLDLCGVQVPNGFTKDGLPAGITLMAPAFNDEYALDVGARFHRTLGLDYRFGNTQSGYTKEEIEHKLAHHEPSVIKVATLQAGKDGQSHFHDLNKTTSSTNFNGNLTTPEKATSILFRATPADWKVDWHHPPRKQYIIQLEGSVEMTASDGSTKTLNPGDVALVEDIGGKGHKSRALSGPTKAAFVAIDA